MSDTCYSPPEVDNLRLYLDLLQQFLNNDAGVRNDASTLDSLRAIVNGRLSVRKYETIAALTAALPSLKPGQWVYDADTGQLGIVTVDDGTSSVAVVLDFAALNKTSGLKNAAEHYRTPIDEATDPALPDTAALFDVDGAFLARFDHHGRAQIKRTTDPEPYSDGMVATVDARRAMIERTDRYGRRHHRRDSDPTATPGLGTTWADPFGAMTLTVDGRGALRHTGMHYMPGVWIENGAVKAIDDDGSVYAVTDGSTPALSAEGAGPGLIRVVLDRPGHGAKDIRLFAVRESGIGIPPGGMIDFVVVSGQSLSTGSGSYPLYPLVNNHHGGAMMLALRDGRKDVRVGDLATLYATQPIDPKGIVGFTPLEPYDNGGYIGQTPAEGGGDLLQGLASDQMDLPWRTVFTAVGVGGAGYAKLADDAPNPEIWKRNLIAATSIVRIADGHQTRATCRAYWIMHGEADALQYSLALRQKGGKYYTNTLDWHADLQRDIKPITGQAADIPMIHLLTGRKIGDLGLWGNVALMDLMRDHPDKIVVADPVYDLHQLFPRIDNDRVHITGEAEVAAGERLGYAHADLVGRGRTPLPLHIDANSIAFDGTLTLTVPIIGAEGDLVIDTTTITERPGETGYGFEVWDDGTRIAVTNVVISGPRTLTLTLASTPVTAAGPDRALLYALRGADGASYDKGTDTLADMPRGNIRTDTTRPSRLPGFEHRRWLCHDAINF